MNFSIYYIIFAQTNKPSQTLFQVKIHLGERKKKNQRKKKIMCKPYLSC